jgi:hypothetical protein
MNAKQRKQNETRNGKEMTTGRNSLWKAEYGKPDEARKIALAATRSYLRSMDIDPKLCSSDEAAAALGDLQYVDNRTIAAKFAAFASVTQLNKFHRDWNRWLKEN